MEFRGNCEPCLFKYGPNRCIECYKLTDTEKKVLALVREYGYNQTFRILHKRKCKIHDQALKDVDNILTNGSEHATMFGMEVIEEWAADSREKQRVADKEHEENIKLHNNEVRFYPYTGWASGKSIKDGRGLNGLIKQLGDKDEN